MQLGPKPLSQRCLQKLSFQTPLPKLRHVSEKCEKHMKVDLNTHVQFHTIISVHSETKQRAVFCLRLLFRSRHNQVQLCSIA